MFLSVFLHYMQETRSKKEAFIKIGSWKPSKDRLNLVFLTTGGSGPSCTKVIKRVAAKILAKRGEQYAHVMGFIKTRLRFSLLQSVLIAVRGVRGKAVKEAHVGFIPFNIIPSCESYKCLFRTLKKISSMEC